MSATKQFIAGALREVVWSERRDSGGMFDATVGVYQDDSGGFVAYVTDWGGGVKSPSHDTVEAAKADVPRLWTKLFG